MRGLSKLFKPYLKATSEGARARCQQAASQIDSVRTSKVWAWGKHDEFHRTAGDLAVREKHPGCEHACVLTAHCKSTLAWSLTCVINYPHDGLLSWRLQDSLQSTSCCLLFEAPSLQRHCDSRPPSSSSILLALFCIPTGYIEVDVDQTSKALHMELQI